MDHFRADDPILSSLLEGGVVLGHPFVTGEIALGALPDRTVVLRMLARLPQALVATPLEVLRLVEHHRLFGTGIGYVDAHLLASARLTVSARLWSRDRRLRTAAQRLGLGTGVVH